MMVMATATLGLPTRSSRSTTRGSVPGKTLLFMVRTLKSAIYVVSGRLLARRRADELDVEVELVEGDAQALPFEGELQKNILVAGPHAPAASNGCQW